MSVSATFSLEDRFSGPLDGMRHRLGGFTTELAALGASMVGAQAGLASLTGIAQKFFDAFARGKELLVLSRQTGESVSDLVVLGKALRQAGLDSGMTGQALWQLQRAMGGVNEAGEPTKHIFAQLGLNLADLQRQSAGVQLQTLSARMAELHTPAERAATAMALFGRSGREMLALLADPGALSRAAKEANGTAELFAHNAEQFHRIEVAIDQAKDKVSAFFAAVAGQAAPAVEAFVGSLSKLDAIHAAGVKELADVVGVLLANLRALGDMLKTAVAPLGALLGGLKGLTQAAISLGVALLEVQIGKWLLGLGQSAMALVKNIANLQAETTALGANSSAQIKNAAARAARAAADGKTGIVAGRLPGMERHELGESVTYLNTGKAAAASASPATSAAGMMMAANVGVALGLLVQQAIVAYTAHIDAQTDKMSGFGKQMAGGHDLAERSQNISSQAEKQELLKQVQEKISAAQAQLGKIPGAEQDFKFYNFLRNQIESVKDSDLSAKESQAAAAARWAAAEEEAVERVGKLYVQLNHLQTNLATETYRAKYEAAGAGEKRQLLTTRAQEITRRGTAGTELDARRADLPSDFKGRAAAFVAQAENMEGSALPGESAQGQAQRLQKAVALREAAKELLALSQQQHALDEAETTRSDRTAKLKAEAESVSAKTLPQHRQAVQDAAAAELAPLRRKRKASTDKSEQAELDAEIGLVTARRDQQLKNLNPAEKLPDRGQPDVDHFAKVGLFVGGQAPALDYQKRTAEASMKLAAWVAAGAPVTPKNGNPQPARVG